MPKGFRLSRRSLLQGGVSAGLWAAPGVPLSWASSWVPARAQAPSPLPNFVFLISDDHSAPDLGCYGNAAVHTPNLDRMAREGVRFLNAFVSSPQCSPNRSAILTGCFPHTIGTSRLHTPMPEWESSILEMLKERGYFVGAFRKVHQGPVFDKRWNFYGARGVPFEKFFDALPPGRPFYLHVGFTDPHRPYRPGGFSPPHDPARAQVPRFLPDTPEVRQDLAHYYDAIARMDAECGRIFEILRERKLEDNTLVVFTGDNGMPFPRAKASCYDSGLRVPLLARWPGKIKPESVARELISHVDLPVTWLEAAGIEKPKKMQGRSLLNLLLGKSSTARAEIFAERNWHNTFDPMRAIRTGRYKLIFNAAPKFPYRPISDVEASPSWQSYLELARNGRLGALHMRLLEPTRPMFELYDLERDPDEFHNLATSPEHAEILQDLKYRLSDWMHETYDFLPPIYQGYPARSGPGRYNPI